jgi:hypothetical protein
VVAGNLVVMWSFCLFRFVQVPLGHDHKLIGILCRWLHTFELFVAFDIGLFTIGSNDGRWFGVAFLRKEIFYGYSCSQTGYISILM